MSIGIEEPDKELLKYCYGDFIFKKAIFNKIENYYNGETDSLLDFEPLPGRSNLIVKTNFVGKLVDEEAQYSFGNKIIYSSKNGDDEIVRKIDEGLSSLKADHDYNLGIELVKNCLAYEINYIKNGKFRSKVISPRDGYMYLDEDDDPVFFMHTWRDDFTQKDYIDIYTDKVVFHYDLGFNLIGHNEHLFKRVPVGFGCVGNDRLGKKTVYKTIKTIQDAYETNFSDVTSEISDFRNAILKIFGASLEDEDENGNKKAPINKNNALLQFDDKNTQDAQWLIKNINDTFIKNTRDDLKDLIYSLTSHIDNNEKMQSNLSGIALRSRLNQLEAKCEVNEMAMANIIKTRLECLFDYLNLKEQCDVNDVEIIFTPNVPVDETMIADMISKIPHDVVSYETMRSRLPFINNSVVEGERIKKEKQESMDMMPDLDNIPPVNEGVTNE